MRFLRTASKIAWRELRSSPGTLLFRCMAVAVGVGALSGVKGFGAAFRSMLFSNAKQLTASDLSAQVWALSLTTISCGSCVHWRPVGRPYLGNGNVFHGGKSQWRPPAARHGESRGSREVPFLRVAHDVAI